ncbi:MAG TPA: hypothetical protein VK774_03850, partial [Solirubrobacteraceae bacterium]|nr:hypothetical protein [Solirubrobacteraceae bacterium]
MRVGRALAALAGLLALAAGLTAGPAVATKPRPYKQPKVRHIWVIVLENEDYAATFGSPLDDPYLAQTLPAQGALLTNYYGTGHESNDNYISLVSGQPPNVETQADCQLFGDFVGALELPGGIEGGEGCVYPASVQNIG